MGRHRLEAFLQGLTDTQILPEDQLNQFVEKVKAIDAESKEATKELAKELVRNGQLTAYQAKMLWRGLGNDLILSHYIIIDKIGEGGMGEVYHARHRKMDRAVALKVMRRERMDNPNAVKRFQREIRAAASMAHENVVLAYDADQTDGVHFFAMEYVDGLSLDQIVQQQGPLPLGEAADYICQTALGLQHAHERNLIHRDIKPSNLLVCAQQGIVKISDLGLARILDPQGTFESSRLTKDGFGVGTPDFVAPEQAKNARNVDIRADIYSLGCTFYYLLAGDVPYPGGTPTEKMLRHTREPLPGLSRKDLPKTVHNILQKMTAKRSKNASKPRMKSSPRYPRSPSAKPTSLGAPLFNPSSKSWKTPPKNDPSNRQPTPQ